ncbi:MAG: molybdate ABC transporter substrate-binding protein [Rhodospirillaceae bacterium]|nr:molybdate ABC transporter substrate-binding protein [Rhodospirillaceae bacterium]
MRRLRSSIVGAALTIALFCGIPAVSAQSDALTILAAASLTNAIEEIGAQYEAETGKTVRFSFAASSALAKQIEAGAPAQIFAAADQKWMDYLAERNLIEADTRVSPIGNSLVLIVPADSAAGDITINGSTDLGALLGVDGRLSVGDPDHVPAGIYAKEALESLGLWAAVEPRLAHAEDVRAALVLVERGEAPLGIVYATDAAISDKVRVIGSFPADSHTPITYPFAMIAGQNGEDAHAFFRYVTGPEGFETFRKYGFSAND